MIKIEDYTLNDIVEMKKPHPCVNKSRLFEIVRLGADIKIKCLACGAIIMLPRNDFNNKAKKVIKEENK